MAKSQLVIPRTLNVFLAARSFKMEGTHLGYEYDTVDVRRASKSRAYMVGWKNGMRMVPMTKQMKFENGDVFVKFGSKKLVIGYYTEA